MQSDLLTVSEAASYLGVTPKHIHFSIRQGSLSVQMGPRKSYTARRFIRYVRKQELDRIKADGFFRGSGA